VRKLAEESKTAATKIAALIDEIQAETQRTVTIADGGAARTARGVETVQQAQAAFNEIGEQVGRVTSLVGDIVTATNGVAGLAEDASASTQQVSASTEETSASSEEVAASAQELAATAQELSDLTGKFRVAA
jgi:methyl-accepting chemotaxis protein